MTSIPVDTAVMEADGEIYLMIAIPAAVDNGENKLPRRAALHITKDVVNLDLVPNQPTGFRVIKLME